MERNIPRAGSYIEPPNQTGGPKQPDQPNEPMFLKFTRDKAKRDLVRHLWATPVKGILAVAGGYKIDVAQFGTIAALVEAIADIQYPSMDEPPGRFKA